MDLGCTPRELPLLVHASEVESGLRDRIAEMESIAMAAEEAMRHAEHPLEVPSYMLPTVARQGRQQIAMEPRVVRRWNWRGCRARSLPDTASCP